MRRSIGRSAVKLYGVPPRVQLQAPAVLHYAPGPATQCRGLAPMVLSLAAMAPTLLSLLIVAQGRFVDPVTALLLIPLWTASLILGIAAAVLLRRSLRQSHWARSGLQRSAIAVHLAFWSIFAIAVFILLARI